MKRKVENADGIYPRTAMPLTADTPAEDQTLLLEWCCRPNTLEGRLAQIKMAIKPIIANLTDQAGTEREETARDLDMRIDKLLTFLPNCDSREAARQGINIGVMAEKIHAMKDELKVVHSNQSRRGARKASSTKTKTAQKDYDLINLTIARHVKKRGRHKQPPDTEIRRRVAIELGFSYSKVLDAAKGGRKK